MFAGSSQMIYKHWPLQRKWFCDSAGSLNCNHKGNNIPHEWREVFRFIVIHPRAPTYHGVKLVLYVLVYFLATIITVWNRSWQTILLWSAQRTVKMAVELNMKLRPMEYLGFTAMDKRFSRPMLPWVIAEIKRRGTSEKVRYTHLFVSLVVVFRSFCLSGLA
jgi:hypothetical protein